MTNYKEYLNFDENEDAIKQEKIMEKLKDTKFDIKTNIKEITVYAEPNCPDCRVLVPFLEIIAKDNKDLKIEYKKRKESYRIPTIEIDGEICFSEFPEEIKELMKDEYNKYNYRTGKYNSILIESLKKIF